MTSQSPRIYTYKITFEEVPYYYYGVHKEKKFGEYYMGSPVANKWCWELYTPKKQILEVFPFTDEGWIEAQKVEGRLIRPVFNTDKWCLNENCMGIYSLEQKSKAGKVGGKKIVEEKLGMFGRTPEEMKETSRKAGKKAYEFNLGVHALTPEERKENGKKSGKIVYEMKVGIYGRSPEQMIEDSKKGGKLGGKRAKELGVGVHALTPEERKENGKKGGKLGGKRAKELDRGIHGLTSEERKENGKKGGKLGGKKTSSQRWICTETGYISTPGGLSSYQKARGIDTSKRKRIS